MLAYFRGVRIAYNTEGFMGENYYVDIGSL